MKNIMSYIRVILFLIVSFFLLEWIVDSGDQWAIVKYPVIWLVLGVIGFIAIIMEVINASVQRVMFKTLAPEEQQRYLENEAANAQKYEKLYKWMLGREKEVSDEEIVLEHEYDGIRELDNVLPPWWVYLFYATIIFAVVYLLRYEVFGGKTQIQELEIEIAKAEKQIEEYKRNNKDLIDINTVEMLTSTEDLNAGQRIYIDLCVACHKDSGGGGIGPNLTDEYWILGGGIRNVFNTISEGGRPGKGMIAWKSDLSPLEIAQVSSYVLTLQGTNPADGKEPEGELWVEEGEGAEI